jgi:hypothetical protein
MSNAYGTCWLSLDTDRSSDSMGQNYVRPISKIRVKEWS